jgi:hypothetical protein
MMAGQMGGRTGDLDNGMFQVNPRGEPIMGGRPMDIRDRVDVRNSKPGEAGGINMMRNQGGQGGDFRAERRDDRGGGMRDERRDDRRDDRRDRDRDRDGRDKRDRDREERDRGK